jgi:hypothetical protein
MTGDQLQKETQGIQDKSLASLQRTAQLVSQSKQVVFPRLQATVITSGDQLQEETLNIQNEAAAKVMRMAQQVDQMLGMQREIAAALYPNNTQLMQQQAKQLDETHVPPAAKAACDAEKGILQVLLAIEGAKTMELVDLANAVMEEIGVPLTTVDEATTARCVAKFWLEEGGGKKLREESEMRKRSRGMRILGNKGKRRADKGSPVPDTADGVLVSHWGEQMDRAISAARTSLAASERRLLGVPREDADEFLAAIADSLFPEEPEDGRGSLFSEDMGQVVDRLADVFLEKVRQFTATGAGRTRLSLTECEALAHFAAARWHETRAKGKDGSRAVCEIFEYVLAREGRRDHGGRVLAALAPAVAAKGASSEGGGRDGALVRLLKKGIHVPGSAGPGPAQPGRYGRLWQEAAAKAEAAAAHCSSLDRDF